METFTCPMCGFLYNPQDQSACPSCPLHQNCTMVCCPACGHTTIDPAQSTLARWATRLLKPERHDAKPPPKDRTTLLDIRPGGQARVVEFLSLSAVQVENLQAYGLAPGHLLQVLQHAPVTVIQIGNTELALEAELASQVEVEQLVDVPETAVKQWRTL